MLSQILIINDKIKQICIKHASFDIIVIINQNVFKKTIDFNKKI